MVLSWLRKKARLTLYTCESFLIKRRTGEENISGGHEKKKRAEAFFLSLKEEGTVEKQESLQRQNITLHYITYITNIT